MLPDPELKRAAARYVDALSAAFISASSGDRSGVTGALTPIAGEIWPGMPAWDKPERAATSPTSAGAAAGRRFNKLRSAEVFVRDSFQCKYCGERLFAVPMMSALSAAYPAELPYVHTYKKGSIHPAYWLVGAEADHFVPGSSGGSWTDPLNHVAACALCNMRKSDYTVEELMLTPPPPKEPTWSGDIEMYASVWEFTGCPNPKYHQAWIRAFDLARHGPRSAVERVEESSGSEP